MPAKEVLVFWNVWMEFEFKTRYETTRHDTTTRHGTTRHDTMWYDATRHGNMPLPLSLSLSLSSFFLSSSLPLFHSSFFLSSFLPSSFFLSSFFHSSKRYLCACDHSESDRHHWASVLDVLEFSPTSWSGGVVGLGIILAVGPSLPLSSLFLSSHMFPPFVVWDLRKCGLTKSDQH